MLLTATQARPTRVMLRPRLDRRIALGACLASAFLLAAAQDLPWCGWLTFLGLVPVCLVINASRCLLTWGALALTYSLYTALTFYWVSLVGPGFFWLLPLAALYNSLFVLIPAASLWAFAPKTPTARLLVLPAAWMLMEILARHLFVGVSWALFGLPLADWPVLSQAAALAGPESLSFLVVAVNVAIALVCRECSWTVKVLALIQGPGLVLAALAWGIIHVHAEGSGATLRAAVIQPNLTQAQKWTPELRRENLATLDRLIDATLRDSPDLIVLPETAVPGFVRYEDDLTQWARGTVIRTRRSLLFGTLDTAETAAQTANVAILITGYKTVVTYRKIRLVPITEYTPNLGPLSHWLSRLRGGWQAYTPGKEATTFDLPEGITFSTMICYEDIFPDLAREFAAAGAHMLFALGNNELFGHSRQSWQQLRRARLTAVAVGLPMVRCTNSGISCVIDHQGALLDMIEGEDDEVLMVQGARVFAVPRRQVETAYRKLGDGLPLTMCGVLIGGVVAGSRCLLRVRRQRRRSRPIPIVTSS